MKRMLPPLRPFDPPWRRWRAGAAGAALLWSLLMLLAAGALAGVLEPQWRAAARALDALPAPPPPPVAQSLAWPAAGAHAARIGRLLALARQHGLEVRALREEPDGRRDGPLDGGAIAWRGVSLSAAGSYAGLRGFAASALAADEALALDSLVLQRADTASATLRAEYQFALGHRAATVAEDAVAAAPAGASPVRAGVRP